MSSRMPEEVADLMRIEPRVFELFQGKGRKVGDLSPMGYDMAFALAVARGGVRERATIATAIELRPCYTVEKPETRYMLRTARVAIERVEAEEEGDLDFEGLTVIDADPPRYEVKLAGEVVTCRLEDLLSPTKFQARHLAVLHRIPKVPSGKGATEKWTDLVNSWLASAEHVNPGEDASPVLFARAAVEERIDGLVVGSPDSESDFGRGCVVYRAQTDRAHLKLSALRGLMRADFPEMSSTDLCDHLRHLQWEPSRVNFGGRVKRSWAASPAVYQEFQWSGALLNDEEEQEAAG